MTEDKYVETYMDNYDALYKMRAAHALGMIGGAASKQALLDAKNNNTYRKDVANKIDKMLKK